jgi:hypothetical protein
MGAITNDFSFSYAESGGPDKRTPPIAAFSVVGGASRSINADSSNISIGSEFEQARQFKNIILFMPGSAGAGDMKAALDLTRFAANKTRFFFFFSVTQQYESKLINFLSISDTAVVTKPPAMIYGDLLMVQFNLPDARITHIDSERNSTSF